jgi:hypothetical protein
MAVWGLFGLSSGGGSVKGEGDVIIVSWSGRRYCFSLYTFLCVKPFVLAAHDGVLEHVTFVDCEIDKICGYEIQQAAASEHRG